MKGKGFKIFIAEDDEDDVLVIKELLQSAFGAEITEIDHAATYSDAVTCLDKNNYDICMFDYRLGDVTGIELLRTVREKGNDTPIIFLTGQGDQEVAVEAMKSGATDYLDKAKLNKETLSHSIRYAIELHKKEQERKHTQEAFQRLSRQMELILKSAGEGIFGLDAKGKITFINPAGSLLLGFNQEDLVGKNAHEIIHHSKADGTPFPKTQCSHFATIKSGTPRHVTDEVFWRKDGTSFPVEYMCAPIVEGGEIVGVVITFKDIAERKRTEDIIRNMAYHDALTGLPNRILLYDRINIAFTHAQRYKEMLAILFVDMDDLKSINDTHGHAVGDLALQELSARLKTSLREVDTVARMSGDEFVVVLPQINQIKDVPIAAQKIMKAIREPFNLAGHTLNITISMGIAVYPRDGKDRETLLKNADRALYKAKHGTRDNYQFFSPI